MVNRCVLCKMHEESCNHILLWCPIVFNIWTMVYNLIGINWVMGGSIKDELCVWAGLCEKKRYLLLIYLSIFWVVLKEWMLELLRVLKGRWVILKMDPCFFFYTFRS